MGSLAAGMTSSLRRGLDVAAAGAGIVCASAALAQPLALEPVATGLNQPMFVTAPANDTRLFYVERNGVIQVQQTPGAAPTPFLNISAKVATDGERGLLGLAFDPNYAANGRFYVNYIDSTTLNTVVERYTVSANANVANTAAQNIITVNQPAGRNNHKAGWIGFRPGEGANLYIATGDGGGGDDPDNFAQNINSNLGKILRLDVSGSGAGAPGNPFIGVDGSDAVWATGLRNPFRNSFDRETGDFYIADVGQSTREEVNVEEATLGGRNYGWRVREGSGQNPAYPGSPTPPGAIDPVFDYARGASDFSPPGQRSSITGGYVYRGDALPSIDGTYFFADFVTGKIGSFVYDPDTNQPVPGSITDRTAELDPDGTFFGPNRINSFGEDAFGELYITNIATGDVYKIIPEPGSLLAMGLLGLCALRRRR